MDYLEQHQVIGLFFFIEMRMMISFLNFDFLSGILLFFTEGDGVDPQQHLVKADKVNETGSN